MRDITPATNFIHTLMQSPPDASAWIAGGNNFPSISGLARFYATEYEGTLVEVEVFGLPNVAAPGSSNFYGMHIHENGVCVSPFTSAGAHYSRTPAEHPNHSGDMPPLLGNQGYAWMAFYDKRFTIPEIIGKSLIIHRMPDNFTTQPAGDSGERIGCGVIK